MTTQTKHPFEAVQVSKASAIEVANRPADMQMPVSQARHVDALSYCSIYKGYGLTAHTQPTNTDLYAADVVIERPGCSTRHFRALDYFYTAAEALGYATRWGRIWVDYRLRKVAERAIRTDKVERQT
jgi:hypothetical protein